MIANPLSSDSRRQPSATILAADDTSESLALLVKILTPAGYQVRPADSGELALAAVAANPPDLILLDIRMKGVDGLEVCRRLKAREETRHIPIILISAFADAKEWVEGLQLGAADYITKPFQTEELLTRVKTHLALSRANLRTLEDQKRAKAALRESEERYRTMMDQAADAIFMNDESGRILDVNRKACESLGYSREELLCKSIVDIDPEAIPTGKLELWGKILAGENFTFESRQIRKDGTTIPVEVTLGSVHLPLGSAVLSIVRDITQRKQAEEALRQTEELLRVTLTNILDPVFITDNDGKFTFICPNVPHILGYSVEEIEAMGTISKLVGDGCFSPEELEMRGEINDIERLIVDNYGRQRVFLMTAKHVSIGEGTLLYSLHDITERKRAEEDRVNLERQLQQARKAESLGRMAGAIAHHFNNKLGVVMGNLELALLDAGPTQQLSTNLLEAQRATVQAAEVSGLMLAYLGQALPKAETFDLARVCREVTEAQERSFISKRVTVKMDIPPHGPTIKANQAQSRQILSNLIVNAWEAIGEGEGDIQVSLRVVNAAEMSPHNVFPADWKPERDTYACIEVSDTGCGVDLRELDLIFDPFFSTKFAGRGLGLAVVLGTVRSYGGAIAVESEPGRGSIFRAFLPVVVQEAQPVQKAEADVSMPIEGSGLVLFVDDEAQFRKMAGLMLGLLGFEAVTAGHGLEAMDIFRMRKDEIGLVILDLTMPGMNDWETLEALRALRPDIPVILASGYDEARVMEGEHAKLPRAFLHKPYSMAELKAALNAALEESSAERLKRDQARL